LASSQRLNGALSHGGVGWSASPSSPSAHIWQAALVCPSLAP